MSDGGPATIDIPWGGGTLPLRLPARWDVAVSRPDVSGPLPDYRAALRGQLEQPKAMPTLRELAARHESVAIVVDDPSRATPLRDALPVVLEALHSAGLPREKVTITFGVGRHKPVDEATMRARLGDAVVDAYRCFSPPVDDLSRYQQLGTTSRGVPVNVFRPVAEAGLRVLIGSVLPHMQAGFGGGYKLIFPGASHRDTLGALHAQGLGASADMQRLLGGDARDNPMRRAIGEAAAMLGPCFSISHLLARPGTANVLRVAAGHPDAVQEALAAEARRRFAMSVAARADVVIVGNDPWPGDPMHSFKTLLQHRAAGRAPIDGTPGVFVGLFHTDPALIDVSFPLRPMRAIAAGGGLAAWAVRHGVRAAERVLTARRSTSAFMLAWARELVVDRTVLIFAPPLRERVGARLGPVRVFADLDELWRAAELSLGRPPRVQAHVFPQGGLTYCPVAI